MILAKISVISVGKLKTDYYKQACEDYSKRIKRYVSLETTEINEHALPKNPSDKEIDFAKQREGEALLYEAEKHDTFFCFDGNGKKYTSKRFSDLIQNNFNQGKSKIAFLVGGSNGLSDEIKKSANGIISFSDMTFAHHLFKVMLLEQIYRAFTILNNEKYHK